MNTKSPKNNSGIIASTIDIPTTKKGLSDFLSKCDGIPLKEIEVELDFLDLVEKYCSKNNLLLTGVINYPLGGYQAEYILDTIQWAVKKNFNVISSNVPLYWLKSNREMQLRKFLSMMIDVCQEIKLRISFESELLSINEISVFCELICDAGISHIKSSSGFSHYSSIETINFIKNNFPDLLLTVDNNLKGDSPELDDLLQLDIDFVCVKEPWLYHF